jgi:hypothetical protein
MNCLLTDYTTYLASKLVTAKEFGWRTVYLHQGVERVNVRKEDEIIKMFTRKCQVFENHSYYYNTVGKRIVIRATVCITCRTAVSALLMQRVSYRVQQ